jgi:hypothetical protein
MKRLPTAIVAALIAAGASAAWWTQVRREQPPTSAVGPIGARPYLRAAHWFGTGWPVNFWNTDLSRRARQDFTALRDDGFNTVVLLVPWAGFAPVANSGELDATRVERLKMVMRVARDLDLRVVLRVGFAWDARTTDRSRVLAVWTDAAVYAAWLDYCERLWQAVRDEPNLEFGFISWEDLWAVTVLTDADLSQRVKMADSIGYRKWLRANHSLESVAKQYEESFPNWNAVPLPARRDPGFELFLDFLDAAWIDRFFVPARERFPWLSMEIRIDSDPIWRQGQLVRWHSHESSWSLPRADWTTIYWSPAIGGANQGETLSAEQAAERLERRLKEVAAVTGARPIFIDQFLVEEHTPGFEHAGRIAPGEVGRFLTRASGILGKYSAGYALWTWRDYAHDAIGNPEFFNGLNGWTHALDVSLVDGAVRLQSNQWIERSVSVDEFHAPDGPVELCVEGQALVGPSAVLAVSDEAAKSRLGELTLGAKSTRSCLSFPKTGLMRLRLSALSDVTLTRVQAIGFLQDTGMRNITGAPKPVAGDYRSLNRSLLSAPQPSLPLSADGWMGRHFVGLFERAGSASAVLRIRAYLPPDWPKRPQIYVSVDGRPLGTFVCGEKEIVEFSVPSGQSPAVIRMEASSVHRVDGDARDLSCNFSELKMGTTQQR